MDLKSIVAEVCRTARETGAYLRAERSNFSTDRVVEKGAHDYVSYVDRGAEEMTVEALRKLLPEAGFVTEEGTVEQSGRGLNWVIDPLDGTTNFIHDNAPYCVSIALVLDGDLLAGVVYEVCRGECYYAWKGGGAYLDGKTLHVSDNPMERAMLCLDLPYRADEYKPVIQGLIDRFYGRASAIRMNGSSAASLCYVAAGRFDGYAEAFIQPWDYSAGALIVREAGGCVTDFAGKEDIFGTHHIVASNGIIHGELCGELVAQNVENASV